MESLDPFHFLLDVTSNNSRSSDELLDYTSSADNVVNIANGSIASASPDEEIIKSRGRRRSTASSTSIASSFMQSIQHRDHLVVALATRKSPRKPPGPLVDYASYFFRSPTPKKTPQKKIMTPKKEPSPSALKARINFRKRLSLNYHESMSSSSSSGSSSPSSSSVHGDSLPPQPKKSCLRNTSTPASTSSTTC